MTLEEKIKSKPTREFAKMFVDCFECMGFSEVYRSKFDYDSSFSNYEEALDYTVELLLAEQPCYTDEEYKEILSKRYGSTVDFTEDKTDG